MLKTGFKVYRTLWLISVISNGVKEQGWIRQIHYEK